MPIRMSREDDTWHGEVIATARRHRSLAGLAVELGVNRASLERAWRWWRQVRGAKLQTLGSYLGAVTQWDDDPAEDPTTPGGVDDLPSAVNPAAAPPLQDHIEELRQCAPWATDVERAALDALMACAGDVARASESLGMTPVLFRGLLSELKRRAASRGWAPGESMTKPTPAGYHVKGVSTFYDGDGNIKGQWVKTRAEEQHKLAALAEAVQALAAPFRGLADPVDEPDGVEELDDELLAVYPMGDPHLGMYAWSAETGQSFDLDIAEKNLLRAVGHLVAVAPPAREALVINLGDFFHADNSSATTVRSGHHLDVDTRWAKVLRAGVNVMRAIVDRALQKHARVTVINEIGNHDDHSSIMLGLCLAEFYAREPRVKIDTSPAKFHWYRHGECLIGTTHGDTIKLGDLPGVMAHDRRQDWGETEHRYWYVGHVHHDRAIEKPGCVVETFRTLAPRDAWAHAAGYRSGQDMKCDVLHKRWGRINRHTIGIRQVFGQ